MPQKKEQLSLIHIYFYKDKGVCAMNISTEERAKILVQSLPYIQQHRGKTIVVKYGGNAMINEELKLAVMNDIVLMSLVGINVVLVHGGGPEINDMLKKIGKESRFVNGMRYTCLLYTSRCV